LSISSTHRHLSIPIRLIQNHYQRPHVFNEQQSKPRLSIKQHISIPKRTLMLRLLYFASFPLSPIFSPFGLNNFNAYDNTRGRNLRDRDSDNWEKTQVWGGPYLKPLISPKLSQFLSPTGERSGVGPTLTPTTMERHGQGLPPPPIPRLHPFHSPSSPIRFTHRLSIILSFSLTLLILFCSLWSGVSYNK